MANVHSVESQRSDPITSVEGVGDFVRELVADVLLKYDGVERRIEPRYPISIPVVATPYDVGRNRAGSKFVAVTRDVSASGVTFLHTNSVDEDFWILEFGRPVANGARLVLEVLYRRPIGPLWEIAGRFVTEPTS